MYYNITRYFYIIIFLLLTLYGNMLCYAYTRVLLRYIIFFLEYSNIY